eukprot:TRINITY_DN59910_c0_g1_i1.p1 TRINITY_DN59910_c0_g1~~TRINITY_DN59910_c0_g1_i1.p1  ORF type:complete len:406 (+),score=148.12 TRINITY_DN59910_c0_g1_i1:76-1293(+)
MAGRGAALAALLLAVGCRGAKPSPGECRHQSAPSDDPYGEFCYLVLRNKNEYDISWSPPGLPPALFQDHILYDLVSLYNLGANASRLSAAYAYHEKTEMLNKAVAGAGAVNSSNWKELIGSSAMNPSVHYTDYVEYYRQQLDAVGLQGTLDRHLPALVGGVFGKLFHGLLALAWGWGETGDEEAAAQGLAWMSTAFAKPGPPAAAPTRRGGLAATFDAMRGDARIPRYTMDPQKFYYVILADLAANHSQALQEYDLSVPDSISQEAAAAVAADMQSATLQLFAAGNFSSYTHVHMIEASRVTRRLLPRVSSPAARAELLRSLWQAMVYNYAIQSCPAAAPGALPPPSRGWADLVEAALAQGDTHLHNIVWVAKAEHARGGQDGALWQLAAQRAVELFEAGGTWAF